jgi:hypothetical protein
MATEIKFRRGTTTQHNTFTGALGEVTVDTTKKTLVVHDGVTPGGQPLPTTASNTPSDNSVSTVKIQDNAVTTSKIADNAVTNAKMADNSINTIEIVDSAITTNKIANSAVTEGKIASGVFSTRQSRTVVDVTAISKTGAGWLDTGSSISLVNNLKNTSSKVKIRVSFSFGANGEGLEIFEIRRGTTSITPANVNAMASGYVATTSAIQQVSFEIEDTPGVTTPTTYRLYWNNIAGGATTRYLGRRGNDTLVDVPIIWTVEEIVS